MMAVGQIAVGQAATDEPQPRAAVAWFTDAAIDNSVRLAKPVEALPEAAGTFGKGVRLTRAVAIDVPVLTQARGYISFWIKPDWNGDDGKLHRILRVGDPDENGLLVEKSDRGLLRFVMASPKRVSAARADVSHWKAGEWHHVVVVWMDFRDKPLGLPIWIDRKIAAGPVAADNEFLDPAAMDDARLWLGDETADASMDELIVRDELRDEISDGQLDLVYRDYFRTAPYEAVRIDPEPLHVPADRRVVVGQPKQFGLEGELPGKLEDMTDFVALYEDWGDFDAKPFITWATSDPKIATVDENGLVTGKAVGRCTLTAEFRGLQAAYPLQVIPIEQPDLDLPWVERLPRYDWAARKSDPAPGDAVQSVAHIFNMGYQAVPAGTVVTLELIPELTEDYAVDAQEARRAVVQKQTLGALAPKEEAVVTFDWTWPEKPVWVRVTVDPDNRISEICEANNQICDLNTARGVLWAHEPEEVNKFLDERIMTLVGSFSVYDSNLAHVRRLEGLLREAVYPSTTPHGVDYAVRLDDNIWRGDFLAGERGGPYANRKAEDKYDHKWWRGSWPHDPIKVPLAIQSVIMHEMGHTMLALPDLYGGLVGEHHCLLRDENGEFYEGGELLPYVASYNVIARSPVAGFTPCGQGYGVLMDACHMWIDESNAGKLQYYRGLSDRPFWGCQGPLVPQWYNWLYVTDVNDGPLVGAAVYMYQIAGGPNGAQYFYDRPKFVGHTDADGRFTIPKETDEDWDDPDTDEVDGSVSISNPFGRPTQPVASTPSCYGLPMFLIKIVSGAQTEFHYLTLPQCNVAYFVDPVKGEYPIRTSLKPADGETPLVRHPVPEAIRETNLRPIAVVDRTELTVKLGDTFTLDGSQSSDPEGQPIAMHEWQLVGGECDPWRYVGVTITGKPKKAGTVRYLFFVNDGLRDSDTIRITVTVVE
jgi:hypothetical protein